MRQSETIGNLATGLVGFHSEVGRIAKDGKNPHFKSNYATLDNLIDETRPILAEHGLSVVQSAASNEDGSAVVTTRLQHKSGEWMESEPLTLKPVKGDPQAMGSAITYGKRYQYGAFLNLSTGEDDDGNAATFGGTNRSNAPVTNRDEQEARRQAAREQAAQRHNQANNATPAEAATPSTPATSGGQIQDGQVKAIGNMVNVVNRKWGDEQGSKLLANELAKYGADDLPMLTEEQAQEILKVFNGAMRQNPNINA